jgi:hypothetical protein
MNLRPSALAAALVAIPAVLCPLGSQAAERDCPGMSVEPDVAFREHWPDLIERIESELSTRADVDACARVDLRLEGDGVMTVEVRLPDGRAASRGVTEREDVIPTLQALLLVPDRAPAVSDAASPLPPTASPLTPAAPRHAPFIDETSRTERDGSHADTAGRSLGVELSLVVGARMGDGQLGVGAGALSFLELEGWLLGFAGRADAYSATGGGDPETALELAILAGRRFDLGGVALDLSAGPAVAVQGLDSSPGERRARATREILARAPNTETLAIVPPPVQTSEPSSGPVPRLLLGARFGFRPRSVFRTFVGIDAEVGPALASSDPSSGHLPGYSLGFSLGATLGTP